MITVYVSIGNSDDKLTQEKWTRFQRTLFLHIQDHTERIHGIWYSLPNALYQNMCVCFEIHEDHIESLKETLQLLAFKQRAISWAVAETEML